MRSTLLAAMTVMMSGVAWAQDSNALMIKGSRSQGSIGLPSARLLERTGWEVTLGYGHDGDVVRGAAPTGAVRGGTLTMPVRWVDQRDLAWLQLAFSPISRIELDVVMPVLLGQTANSMAGMAAPRTGSAALGDLFLGLRLALLEPKSWNERGLLWTLQGGLYAPTGGADTAFHESTARADASTTVTWQSGQRWSVTGHGGFTMGQNVQVADQLLGDRLTLGGAFAYRLGDVQLSGDLISLINVGTSAPSQPEPARASLEVLLGARYLHDFFFADVGVGVAPIDNGITPRWRMQLALGARGLFDSAKPPPVDVDVDRDGVLGATDACPSVAEDLDGFEDGDGCPDLDDDRDGVADARDLCPRDPEDKDGVSDADGCPERDADSDGVPDERDQCPLAPEDFDGFEDADGCPEAGVPDAVSHFRAISLSEQAVFFEVGSATLDANALSTLRDVARVLLKQEGAVLLTGHADDQGPDSRNDELSVRRADAVKKVLLEAGIPAARLSSRGAGHREPVTQSTGFGHSLNRSVTFSWAQ